MKCVQAIIYNNLSRKTTETQVSLALEKTVTLYSLSVYSGAGSRQRDDFVTKVNKQSAWLNFVILQRLTKRRLLPPYLSKHLAWELHNNVTHWSALSQFRNKIRRGYRKPQFQNYQFTFRGFCQCCINIFTNICCVIIPEQRWWAH